MHVCYVFVCKCAYITVHLLIRAEMSYKSIFAVFLIRWSRRGSVLGGGE